ncbi:MAG TPA: PASTA domain-containing protein, partial [Nocardioidaceae bacterium]
LYAVGVVLFEMLTGSVPFAGDSAVAVALRHLQEEVPDVRDRAPDVPPALAGVMARATAKDPQNRFADAEQMEQALRGALARPDETTTAVLPAVAPPGTSPGRARGRWAAVAAAVVVAAAGLGWFASQGGPDPTTAPASPPEPAQQTRPTPTLEPSPSPTTPPPSPEPTVTGPVVPSDALGRDVEELEERLKEAGYDVKQLDVDAEEPEDSVVATVPAPGEPLSPEQTVVLVASEGEEPDEPSSFTVPAWLVGADAKEAERSVKDSDVEVHKVDTRSPLQKDTVVATWPAPGVTAEAGTVVLVVSKGD